MPPLLFGLCLAWACSPLQRRSFGRWRLAKGGGSVGQRGGGGKAQAEAEAADGGGARALWHLGRCLASVHARTPPNSLWAWFSPFVPSLPPSLPQPRPPMHMQMHPIQSLLLLPSFLSLKPSRVCVCLCLCLCACVHVRVCAQTRRFGWSTDTTMKIAAISVTRMHLTSNRRATWTRSCTTSGTSPAPASLKQVSFVFYAFAPPCGSQRAEPQAEPLGALLSGFACYDRASSNNRASSLL